MKRNYTIPRHLLDGLEAFVRVAERRNFRAAAEDLSISPSALSQKIRTLETRMGVSLLARTTRSVGLTQAGEIFLARANPAFEELSAAYDEARNLGRPAGLLRLHMSRAIVHAIVVPILDGFCAAYPDIEVEISTEDTPVETDVIQRGYDAGVAHRELIAADMVAVRLSPAFRYVVVGSPAYLEQHGRPARLSDLRHHNCVRSRTATGAINHWHFVDGERPVEMAIAGNLIINEVELHLSAALRGLGLAYIPDRLVTKLLDAGKLEVVLGEFAPTMSGAFLYYPNRFQILPKLRVFIDYLQSYLAGERSTGSEARTG